MAKTVILPVEHNAGDEALTEQEEEVLQCPTIERRRHQRDRQS
jgi:hypothetical protein